MNLPPPPFGPGPITITDEVDGDAQHTNAYLYSYIAPFKNLTITLGGSYDDFDPDNDDEIKRWIIGNNAGVLVDSTDIDNYAKKLIETYEKNWGDGPIKRAQEFSWIAIIQKYKKLIKDLVC